MFRKATLRMLFADGVGCGFSNSARFSLKMRFLSESVVVGQSFKECEAPQL